LASSLSGWKAFLPCLLYLAAGKKKLFLNLVIHAKSLEAVWIPLFSQLSISLHTAFVAAVSVRFAIILSMVYG
jgi:hypothetical protein